MDMLEIKAQEEHMIKLSDEILLKAKQNKTILRLIGGLAIRVHCPNYANYHYLFGRKINDLDFVGYSKQVKEIGDIFTFLGFKEDKNIALLYGTSRRIFNLANEFVRIDINLDRFIYCHKIDLRQRLEIDYPTVSIADLLLSKLQIVKLDKRDILDIIMLLLEHPLGSGDNEMINISYIKKLCSKNWGLWKTISINLQKLSSFLKDYIDNKKDMENVNARIERAQLEIADAQKSIKWRLRNIVGTRMKWYNEVEDLEGAI